MMCGTRAAAARVKNLYGKSTAMLTVVGRRAAARAPAGRARLCAPAAVFAYNRRAHTEPTGRAAFGLRARRVSRHSMPFALLLALAPVAGATLPTSLYDGEASFPSRLCAGVCVGLAALGLAGFVLASWLGMTPAALALAGALCASPLLLLLRRELRALAGEDIAGSARAARR